MFSRMTASSRRSRRRSVIIPITLPAPAKRNAANRARGRCHSSLALNIPSRYASHAVVTQNPPIMNRPPSAHPQTLRNALSRSVISDTFCFPTPGKHAATAKGNSTVLRHAKPASSLVRDDADSFERDREFPACDGWSALQSVTGMCCTTVKINSTHPDQFHAASVPGKFPSSDCGRLA